MTTRLDRLRQVREGLEGNDAWSADRVHGFLCLTVPDWLISSGDLATGRFWLFHRRDKTRRERILNPLTSVDGALWLAKQALPDELWPPVLTPESGGYGATCEIRTQHDGMIYRACPTLALAVCWSVVAALIALEEREVVG